MELVFSNRVNGIQGGIFSVLNEHKNELIEQGMEVFNFSIGTPDFEPAKHIVDAMVKASQNPANYKYAISDKPELIRAMQDYYASRFGVRLEQDEIMSVYGSQEGMTHISWALCNPGELVLIPNPGYPTFNMGPHLCDVTLWEYPLYEEKDFILDFNDIPSEIAEKAKFMIVSYPLNPVGKLANDEFYVKLIDFAKKYNIIVLHDNAYADLVFGGCKGKSFLEYEGAKEVGVEFYSLSKTYNMTGMRVAFVVGNAEIIAQFKKLRSQIDYGIFPAIQYAAVAALTGPQEMVKAQCEEYDRRNKALCGGLRKIGWDVEESQGSMFVWAKIPEKYASSEIFVVELMDNTGVIVVPGTAFGSLGEGYVRFALVHSVEQIERAIGKIEESGILK